MAHRLSLWSVALAIAGLLPLSCKEQNDTWIVVHVVSDDSLALDAVDLVARSTATDAASGRETTAHFADPGNVYWSLFPEGDSKTFTIDVEARGLKDGSTDPVVVQRAQIAFKPHARVDLTLTLDSACVVPPVSCPANRTCQRGRCVDPGMLGMPGESDGGASDAPADRGSAAADARADGGDASTDGGGAAVDAIRDMAPDVAPDMGVLAKGLGTLCGRDDECGSGHCVDGLCCNDACTGSCQQCDTTAMPGYCVAVASGQPAPSKRAACTRDEVATCKQTGLCDGKGACQIYVNGQVCKAAVCDATSNSIVESRCDGMGMCKAGTPLSCAPFRCKTGDTMCARTCAGNTDCDGQPCLLNSCGKLKVGSACALDADCELGFCVDAVCCNVRCAGRCQACNLSTSVGTCSNVRSGQPVGTRAACAGTGTCGGSCNGATECSYPPTTTNCRAASCVTATLTASANCDGLGACPAASTSTCAGHLRCQAGAAVCLPTCSVTADCLPGFYCSGTTCTATKAVGASCVLGTECASGQCADSVCCDTSCTGSCLSCATTAAPGTCSKVLNGDDNTCTSTMTCNAAGTCLRKLGQSCGTGADCASGFCADGVCCSTACTGSCQACNLTAAPGTCGLVSGAPRAGHTACGGTGACTGTCNGQSASCTLPAVGTDCGVCQQCNSSGACVPGYQGTTDSTGCNAPQTCNPTTSTRTAAQTCSNGSCVAAATSCPNGCTGNECTICGGLNQACCAGSTCSVSTAACCGGVCVDVISSAAHCGASCQVCGGTRTLCSSGACVQCLSDANCSGSTPTCDIVTHSCVCRRPSPTNLLINPGFDTDLHGWGGIVQNVEPVWSGTDSEGCINSGSVHGANTDGAPFQCVPVTPGARYFIGGKFQAPSDFDSIQTSWYTDANCSAFIDFGPTVAPATAGLPGWTAVSAMTTAPATAHSLFVTSFIFNSNMDQPFVNSAAASF